MKKFDIGGQKISMNTELLEHIMSVKTGLHLLDSPTGSGKSFMMARYASSVNRALILSPFVALGSNIETELKDCQEFLDVDKTISIANGETVSKNSDQAWSGDAVIATYDQFVKYDDEELEKFDVIFIDEPQTLYEDSYRKVMSACFSKLKQLSASVPVWCLSATLIDGYLNIANIVKVHTTYEYVPEITVVAGSSEEIHALVMQKSLDAKHQNKMLCVLRNHKRELLDYENGYKAANVSSVILDADHKNDKKTKRLLQTQTCDQTVLLMTKAGQAGVSILNNNLHELLCVYDAGMTPESIKQFVSRVRSEHTPKLTMCFIVNTSNEDAVERFIQRRKDTSVFDVKESLDTIKIMLNDARSLVNGMKKVDESLAMQTWAQLKNTDVIPNHIPYEDLMNHEICDVHVAQAAEILRQQHYERAHGQLLNMVASNNGINVVKEEDFTDVNVVVKFLDTVRLSASETRKLKKQVKEYYWSGLVNNGVLEDIFFEVCDVVMNPATLKAQREIYGNFVDVVRHVDKLNRNDTSMIYKALHALKCDDLKKYKKFGKFIVNHSDVWSRLKDKQWLGDNEGQPLTIKTYNKIVNEFFEAKSINHSGDVVSDDMYSSIKGVPHYNVDVDGVKLSFEVTNPSSICRCFNDFASFSERREFFEKLFTVSKRQVGKRGSRQRMMFIE